MGRDGRTAVAAAAMAALLGVIALPVAVLAAFALSGDDGVDAAGVVIMVAIVVIAAFLLFGAASVLLRRSEGPILIGVGGAAVIVGVIWALIAASQIAVDPERTWETESSAMTGVWVIGVLVIVWTVSMLVLALLPSTRRRCRTPDDVDYTAAARRLEQRVRGL